MRICLFYIRGMKVKVDTTGHNPAFISIIQDYSQILPVDANFFIAFDRKNTIRGALPIPFSSFKKFWLDPLFLTFPHLAVHQAVFNELVNYSSRTLVQSKIEAGRLILLDDNEFDADKESYRKSIEKMIAAETAYEPEIDNADDRGEVKSLSYIATKPLNYFCSHDSRALRLLESPLKESIGLSEVGSIQIYEVLYYLRRMCMVNPGDGVKGLKMIYKYLYYAIPSERQRNPEWGNFVERMDVLYQPIIETSTGKPIPFYPQ